MWQYGNVRDHQVRSNAVTNQRTEKISLRPVSVKIQTSTFLYDILFHQQPNICTKRKSIFQDRDKHGGLVDEQHSSLRRLADQNSVLPPPKSIKQSPLPANAPQKIAHTPIYVAHSQPPNRQPRQRKEENGQHCKPG